MRDLLEKLERHSRIVLLLTLSGAFAILWMGLIIVRNFNRPLTELIHITRAVANGNLPVMNQTQEKRAICGICPAGCWDIVTHDDEY